MDAVLGKPLAMATGVLVPSLHGLGQREENRLGLFERINRLLLPQHGADPGTHYAGLQRPGEKLIGAGGNGLDLMVAAADIGDHQDRNQLCPAVGLDPPAKLGSIDLRHYQVDNDEIDIFAFENRQSFRRTAGFQQAVGGRLEHTPKHPPADIIAVDDQNGRRLFRAPGRGGPEQRRARGGLVSGRPIRYR